MSRQKAEQVAKAELICLEGIPLRQLDPKDARQIEIYWALIGAKMDMRILSQESLSKIGALYEAYCVANQRVTITSSGARVIVSSYQSVR